ncbi:MAG: phosphotransferase, partial [Acidimicrobiales bacterium]
MTDQSEQTHPSEQTQPSAQTQPAERADQVGDLAVVAEPEDLTPAWLTRALGSTGAFAVTAVESQPIGTGQMGSSFRLQLTYAGDPGSLPATIVAKLPSPNPDMRPMAAGAYRTELGFYLDLAGTVAVRTPTCHHAAIAEDNATFVLLLEDLHPARQGDQIVGATLAEAEAASVNLAGLHGPRWCDPTLFDLPWVNPVDAEGAAMLGEVFASAVDVFVERYAGRLDPADGPLLAEIAQVMGRWIVGRPERFGPVHGDYRMDNLMFFPGPTPDTTGGMAAVDWQTIGVGLPARDLAYFLETSLEPDLRRQHER